MISAKVSVCGLLTTVYLLSWVEGCDGRCNNHCIEERSGSTAVYFGLMLSYPDPLERKALAGAFDDSHDIAPAAYLAVEKINNRSDLLSDYRIKLLPLDGGCTVTDRTVIGINNLICSCEPIVGIIGPSCGVSALLVGDFTGRDQFSMVTIHYGERNILRNRKIFPYAFGILGATFIYIQAFTDLIVRNYWTRVVLLYSEDYIFNFKELSIGIEEKIKRIPGFEVAFTSPIYEYYIPLQEVKQSLARVIFIIATVEETLRTLCLAFHERMIFPQYQWVFKEQFENDFKEITFSHEGKHYFCTEEDISTSIYKSVNFVWSLGSGGETGTADGHLTSSEYTSEYEEGYDKQRRLYANEYNVSSMPVEWARGIYDAVWSLAFALNNSLNEINKNLSEIVPGSKKLAQIIASHMSDVEFHGVSGRIDFDKRSGFNIARQINIYQFGAAKSSTLIGFHTSKELIVLTNKTTPQFIMPTFLEKHTRVSVAVAAAFLIICVALLLLILSTQVINILYRNHSSIKATSPKLNHFIFLGFYLIVVGMILHTVIEAWPHSLSNQMLSNTCKTLPWFLNIGTTLVIGIVCVKTWRLYRIYTSAKRGARLNSKGVADRALIGYVGVFTCIDAFLCLFWTCIDPPKYVKTVSESIILYKTSPMVTVTGSCQSTWLVYWTSVLTLYKCVMIVCTFFLALFTKMRRKEFKTNNLIILSYMLGIAVGLGIPIFIIVSIADVSVSTRFIITSVFVDTIFYICLFTLFLPSTISLIVKKQAKSQVTFGLTFQRTLLW